MVSSFCLYMEYLPEKKPTDLSEDHQSCNICMEDFTMGAEKPVSVRCGHIFGSSCIETWIKTYISSARVDELIDPNVSSTLPFLFPSLLPSIDLSYFLDQNYWTDLKSLLVPIVSGRSSLPAQSRTIRVHRIQDFTGAFRFPHRDKPPLRALFTY